MASFNTDGGAAAQGPDGSGRDSDGSVGGGLDSRRQDYSPRPRGEYLPRQPLRLRWFQYGV
jgi:hypothetical protein